MTMLSSQECGAISWISSSTTSNISVASEFFGSEVTHDLAAFKSCCDVIVANRWSDDLSDVADKVYARDLFKRD